MYNRYIPRSDGSYQKSKLPDQSPKAPRKPAENPAAPPEPHHTPVHHNPPPPEPMVSFLKRLLPRGFDTGDLIVVLLILLMAGDCEEERSNAMLTLAIYFFL